MINDLSFHFYPEITSYYTTCIEVQQQYQVNFFAHENLDSETMRFF